MRIRRKVIGFRVSPLEYTLLADAALARGQRAGEFCRRVAVIAASKVLSARITEEVTAPARKDQTQGAQRTAPAIRQGSSEGSEIEPGRDARLSKAIEEEIRARLGREPSDERERASVEHEIIQEYPSLRRLVALPRNIAQRLLG